MPKPKIFVFAPILIRAGDTYANLEKAGFQLAVGDKEWRKPG